mmetsp:Transcript_2601/g.3184  ORF Transcript_2601/g.3184 Transcript_2601/m.3184 type:complete len:329 (-) Transcript_2601:262-1248(-)
MAISSSISDVSSWDDCDSRSSWDMVGNQRASSQASSIGVAVISELDAFSIHDTDVQVNDDDNDNDDDISDSLSLDMCTVSSTTTTCCPLTLERFRHPYYCEVDHRVYEKAIIITWVRENGTSPITRQPVRLNQLRPFNRTDDDDDDDTDSISTEMGWPRPRNSPYQQLQQQQSTRSNPNNSNTIGNYKSALLIGAGGVESEQAKILTKKRAIAIKPTTHLKPPTTENQSKRQTLPISLYPRANIYDNNDDDEDNNLFYSDYETRKAGLSRYGRRLVIRTAQKGRSRFNSINLNRSSSSGGSGGSDRCTLTKLGSIEEDNYSDDDEGNW